MCYFTLGQRPTSDLAHGIKGALFGYMQLVDCASALHEPCWSCWYRNFKMSDTDTASTAAAATTLISTPEDRKHAAVRMPLGPVREIMWLLDHM